MLLNLPDLSHDCAWLYMNYSIIFTEISFYPKSSFLDKTRIRQTGWADRLFCILKVQSEKRLSETLNPMGPKGEKNVRKPGNPSQSPNWCKGTLPPPQAT